MGPVSLEKHGGVIVPEQVAVRRDDVGNGDRERVEAVHAERHAGLDHPERHGGEEVCRDPREVGPDGVVEEVVLEESCDVLGADDSIGPSVRPKTFLTRNGSDAMWSRCECVMMIDRTRDCSSSVSD